MLFFLFNAQPIRIDLLWRHRLLIHLDTSWTLPGQNEERELPRRISTYLVGATVGLLIIGSPLALCACQVNS